MKLFNLSTLLAVVFLGSIFGGTPLLAQSTQSQEISEVDGQPVLLKHLPDYESVRWGVALHREKNQLKATVADPVVDSARVLAWDGSRHGRLPGRAPGNRRVHQFAVVG